MRGSCKADMCGIAGIVNWNGEPISPVVLQRMTDAIIHRGPDDEGLFTDGAVGLGHRRLSIIDLSPAGRQPMQTPDGRFVISYNGEVYNFQELKVELETLGWRFRSRTDSEVVLYALAQWGVEALHRFNGMFALALWDRRDKELLLARDRYGIKPLYYADVSGRLLFGSEIKALLAHGALSADMDAPGLLEYLTFQNFFTDRTLFRHVRLLPPGSFVQVRLAGDRTIQAKRFWTFDFADNGVTSDRSEVVEELARLFHQAVNRQLVSDVPLGCYLSGGMDTGAITAVAASQLPEMRSFTVGFDLTSASGLELGFDERGPAERMSYLFGTEHYEMVLKAGDMQRVMGRLMWHLEEPRVGQSYPNFFAAQLASRFCTVALSGAGGDELFGGYPWRYYRAVVNDDFEHYIDKYYQYWQRLLPNRELQKLTAPVRSDVKEVWTRDIFRNVFDRHAEHLTRPEDYINHSLHFEARTFLHGLLVVEDKLSMAHSLETRVPFLDNDLVDFAQHVPVAFKLGNLTEVVRLNENTPGAKTEAYFRKTRDGKLILREAMRRHLPGEITDGIKQGFSAPDASWFRGESIEYVKQQLMGRDARIFQYLDRSTVQRLVTSHLEGKENRRLLIWSLLCLEEWCRVFMDGQAPQPVGRSSRPLPAPWTADNAPLGVV